MTPLGAIFYKAAKSVLSESPSDFSRNIMTSAMKHALTVQGEDLIKYENLGLYDLLLPQFASGFLNKFPTIELAIKKYPRLIPASAFFSSDQLATVEQILRLNVEEAKMLITAKPLVMEFKDKMSSQDQQPKMVGKGEGGVKEIPKPPEPKKHGGKIELWLDWYHTMLDNGYKCTLNEVANKSGYSLGYIKQKHMIYRAKTNQNT